jgi:probable 2-oxoglutarate dehydrogenase E1 component DHKTD1
MLRDYRKPLIIAAPKVGLKHPKAYSNIADFAHGNVFKPTLTREFGELNSQVKKVILCSGKIALDIDARLETANLKHRVKVIRVEELAPFPILSIKANLEKADGV